MPSLLPQLIRLKRECMYPDYYRKKKQKSNVIYLKQVCVLAGWFLSSSSNTHHLLRAFSMSHTILNISQCIIRVLNSTKQILSSSFHRHPRDRGRSHLSTITNYVADRLRAQEDYPSTHSSPTALILEHKQEILLTNGQNLNTRPTITS